MFISRGMSAAEIVVRAARALGDSQGQLGQRLGVSRRTISRWTQGTTSPVEADVVQIVRLVFPRDPALAARIALEIGATPESLGLVAPAPARPALPAELVVEGVVCAAADAGDVSPRAMKAALRAAMKRARELGVTMEEVEKALAPPAKAS